MLLYSFEWRRGLSSAPSSCPSWASCAWTEYTVWYGPIQFKEALQGNKEKTASGHSHSDLMKNKRNKDVAKTGRTRRETRLKAEYLGGLWIRPKADVNGGVV